MIYAFNITLGWQCPRCGKGKMAEGVGFRRCMKCAWAEFFNA